MLTDWRTFIKTLVKSSLDSYVLPGTRIGTEILWLYMIGWKRTLATVTFALVYLLCAQLDLPGLERVLSAIKEHEK